MATPAQNVDTRSRSKPAAGKTSGQDSASGTHNINENRVSQIGMWIFSISVIMLLIAGFINSRSDDLNITPEEGLGYYLGLIGGIMMLLLVLYPLRKHLRFMRHLGGVKHWFRTHMLMGIIGPVLVIFHSNFKLGSQNSTLAFWAMVIVAGSGIVGRFIYKRVHFGLYGQRASLQELRSDLKLTRGKLSDSITLSRRNIEKIKSLETYALAKRGFISGLLHLPLVTLRCMSARVFLMSSIKRELRKQARERVWDKEILHHLTHDALKAMRMYIKMLLRTAHFSVYAKLLSFWHVIHLPLFILLVITGGFHVFATHSY